MWYSADEYFAVGLSQFSRGTDVDIHFWLRFFGLFSITLRRRSSSGAVEIVLFMIVSCIIGINWRSRRLAQSEICDFYKG